MRPRASARRPARTTRDAAKALLRNAIEQAGFHVTRRRLGLDPMSDIRTLLVDVPRPTVFDVGANVGQSVGQLADLFTCCHLHAFEPGPETFRELEANTRAIENLRLVHAGVGSSAGTQTLIENEHSVMSSFLEPGEMTWGRVVRETPIEVVTLDDYCSVQGVDHIDLLKSDTQGYELEVLKGSAGLIEANRVGLVYMEIIYSALYDGLPSLDEVYRFLVEHGFRLVGFYNFASRYEGELPSWCDALFANERAFAGSRLRSAEKSS